MGNMLIKKRKRQFSYYIFITIVSVPALNFFLKYTNIMAVIEIIKKNEPLVIFVRMTYWILNQIWVFLGSL